MSKGKDELVVPAITDMPLFPAEYMGIRDGTDENGYLLLEVEMKDQMSHDNGKVSAGCSQPGLHQCPWRFHGSSPGASIPVTDYRSFLPRPPTPSSSKNSAGSPSEG